MSKEVIIDNLERILKIADTDEPDEGRGYPLIKLLANQTIGLLKQKPTMDEMTKKFNESLEELKSMFTVSQAMAKNSFDTTLSDCRSPVEGKTDNPDPSPKER